jgi:hypothetical protein
MADESGLSRNRRYIVWDTEKASLNKLQTIIIIMLQKSVSIMTWYSQFRNVVFQTYLRQRTMSNTKSSQERVCFVWTPPEYSFSVSSFGWLWDGQIDIFRWPVNKLARATQLTTLPWWGKLQAMALQQITNKLRKCTTKQVKRITTVHEVNWFHYVDFLGFMHAKVWHKVLWPDHGCQSIHKKVLCLPVRAD